MRLRVLGRPALVGGDGAVQELRGGRQIGLLCLLAAHRGQRVSRDLLEHELWGVEVSDATLRVTVKRLRDRFEAVTGSDPVQRRGGGYVLALDDDDVDQARFEALAATCRQERQARRPGRAVAAARAADELWSGPAFDGASDLPSVRPEHQRLHLLRLDVTEEHASALLEQGEPGAALEVLDRLVVEAPFREVPWALRMVALYALHRQQEALATARGFQQRLVDELGIVPGVALREVEQAILEQRPLPDVMAVLLPPPPVRTAPARTTPRRPTAADWPWVGHRALVAELRDLAKGALGARVAVLEGVMGIGKSRLAHHVVDELPVRCAWGSCGRAGVVSDPVDQILASLGWSPEPAGGAEALQDMVAGAGQGSVERHQAAVVASAAAAIEAHDGQVVIVVDDVHRIDERVADVLGSLVETTPSARWMILVRPDGRTAAAERFLAVLSRQEPLWRTLGPLGEADVAVLAEAFLGDRPELDDWAAVVARHAAGNPFLTIELLRHLQRTRDPDRLPESIRAAVTAEIADLGADATALADCLALAQRPLPVDLLGGAAEIPRAEVGRVVGRLVGAGFATVDGGDAVLAHEVVREALLDRLSDFDRRRRHEALATALGEAAPSFDDERLHHLLGSGCADPQILDEVAASALDRLRHRLANEDAVRLGERWLAAVGDQDPTQAGIAARIQLGAALTDTGQRERGGLLLDAARERLARFEAPALVADSLLARDVTETYGAVTPDDVDLARRALADLPSDEWRRRALLAGWLAFVLAGQGDTDEARLLLRRSQLEVVDRSTPDIDGAIAGLLYRTDMGADGDPARLQAAFDEVRSVAVTGGAQGRVTFELTRMDHALRFLGIPAHAEAVDGLAETTVTVARSGHKWLATAARAGNRLAAGALDEVDDLIAEAARRGQGALGTGPTMVGHVHRLLADLELGRLAGWRPLVPDEPVAGVGSVLAAQGLVFADTGEHERLTAVAEALVECGGIRQMNAEGWAFGASLMADIAAGAGSAALAELLDADLRPHCGTGLSVVGVAYVGMTDRALGRSAAVLGDLHGAVDLLEHAVDEDRKRGAPRWAARAADAAARIRRQRGAPGDAEHADALLLEADRLRSTRPPA